MTPEFFFQNMIQGAVVQIDTYNGAIVLEFISWIQKEKKIMRPDSIGKNQLIDLVSEYLKSKQITPDWENINQILKHILRKNTVINKAKELFGLETSIALDKMYFKFLNAKYTSLILFPHNERQTKINFFSNYRKDLESLTSNYMNILFSKNDTLNRSGYAVLNSINESHNRNISLPAIIIWNTNKGMKTSRALSIKGISGEELFRYIEKITFNIKSGNFEKDDFNEDSVKKTSSLPQEHIDLLYELKRNIGKSKIEMVLLNLGKLIESYYPSEMNQILLIKDLRRRIKDLEIKGTIENSEKIFHENKLNNSTLNLIDKILYK